MGGGRSFVNKEVQPHSSLPSLNQICASRWEYACAPPPRLFPSPLPLTFQNGVTPDQGGGESGKYPPFSHFLIITSCCSVWSPYEHVHSKWWKRKKEGKNNNNNKKNPGEYGFLCCSEYGQCQESESFCSVRFQIPFWVFDQISFPPPFKLLSISWPPPSLMETKDVWP